MSLLFLESFDGGDSALGKWDFASGGSIVSTTPRFAGTNSLQTNNNSGTIRRKDLGAGSSDTLIVGMAVYIDGLTNDSDGSKYPLSFTGDSDATQHVTLNVNAAGAINVYRGVGTGTPIASSASGVISASTWHYVELKAVLHDSAGEIYVQVDGVQVISATGLDTKNGGTLTVFGSVRFGSIFNTTIRQRDIYICNDAGSVNNDFLGDCKVSYVTVTSDLTPEEWDRSTGSDSFALVDEATPNGDTDYIESAVEGEITRMGLGDISDTTHVIYGIQTSMYAKKDDAGDRSARVGIFSDATLENGADHVQGTSYTTFLDIFELDPDGDVAFTPTSVNALALQVEVRP